MNIKGKRKCLRRNTFFFFPFTGERPFKCDFEGCGKTFTRNEELTRHKRIHTGIRPHACFVCGKRFGRKDHLKKHMRTHENRDPYRLSATTLGIFGQHPFSPYNFQMWYICTCVANDFLCYFGYIAIEIISFLFFPFFNELTWS